MVRALIAKFLLWILPEGVSRAERRRRWKAEKPQVIGGERCFVVYLRSRWQDFNRARFTRCKCGTIRPRFGICRECLRRAARRAK